MSLTLLTLMASRVVAVACPEEIEGLYAGEEYVAQVRATLREMDLSLRPRPGFEGTPLANFALTFPRRSAGFAVRDGARVWNVTCQSDGSLRLWTQGTGVVLHPVRSVEGDAEEALTEVRERIREGLVQLARRIAWRPHECEALLGAAPASRPLHAAHLEDAVAKAEVVVDEADHESDEVADSLNLRGRIVLPAHQRALEAAETCLTYDDAWCVHWAWRSVSTTSRAFEVPFVLQAQRDRLGESAADAVTVAWSSVGSLGAEEVEEEIAARRLRMRINRERMTSSVPFMPPHTPFCAFAADGVQLAVEGPDGL